MESASKRKEKNVKSRNGRTEGMGVGWVQAYLGYKQGVRLSLKYIWKKLEEAGAPYRPKLPLKCSEG